MAYLRKNYKENIIPRFIPIIAIFLQILIGGIRFSGGRALQAISAGDDINASIFQLNPLTQYVWESPLNVGLLKIYPGESFVSLGILFTFLAFMPILGVFFNKSSSIYQLSSLMLVATPALKISMQNIGVGDGLISFLIILLLSNFKNKLLSFCSILFIGLWHPGQAPFIAVSALISCLLYLENSQKIFNDLKSKFSKKVFVNFFISISSALIFSRIILLIYNSQLGFEYLNRKEYLFLKSPEFLLKNLIFSPISLVFPISIILIFSSGLILVNRKIKIISIFWIAFCSILSLFTTDVSRVSFLILSPIFLILLRNIFLSENNKICNFPKNIFNKLLIVLLLINSLFPQWTNWSGLDFSLWGSFFSDLCKYNLVCFP